MSIPFISENNATFSRENNIRIAIAGLAICKFGRNNSTIRFLRHVEDHRLKLTIIQRQASDMAITDTESYMVSENTQTIKIEGAETPTSTDGFSFKPATYQENELKMMLDLNFLHGHRLEDKTTGLPDKLPTNLQIFNCLFYTAELTDNEFDLTKEQSTIKLGRKFGKVLGGYMKVLPANKLKITISGGLGSTVIERPLSKGDVNYLYEVQFNNSCFDENGTPCPLETSVKESTDFLEIYEILEDKVKPEEIFDLKPIKPQPNTEEPTPGKLEKERKGINTGACLPVVQDPPLN